MKHPRASSQWKLPWWVPTRFWETWFEGEDTGEKDEELAVAIRENARGFWCLRKLKVKSLGFWSSALVRTENIS